MKKFLGSKTAILILGGLSILVVFYMIASLGGLELRPAKPFAYVQESRAPLPGEPPAWDGIGYLVVLFLAVLGIVFFLLPPDLRKKYLWGLVQFALVGIILILILSQLGEQQKIPPPQEPPVASAVTPMSEPIASPEPLITPAIYTPPQVSPWTSYVVALLILLAVMTGWAWMIWRKSKVVAPLDALAEIARSTLDDIDSGKDWGDSILNSYYRMNRMVADWRGVHRQSGMTPAEFAGYLISTHLPPTAVSRLTALFERVRYGSKQSTPEDIQEAVECLTAILEYCQAAK